MNYTETVEYLFTSAPLFQQQGAGAYKEGLENTYVLDEHFNHPHRRYKTIHIAGTNGKGSCSHTIAAALQAAGYRVGLFTSPHLTDFRERIRVNGICISKEYVTDFVEQERSFFEPLHPSFFELTTAMAFKYFAESHVDYAVIEVGLGGRMDCTNIITPILEIITNISFDHTQFLGHTLAEIASEKAGIIKKGVPIIIGENQAETRPVFEAKTAREHAPIFFAEDEQEIVSSKRNANGGISYQTKSWGDIEGQLGGLCQIKNTNTILCALNRLNKGILPHPLSREDIATAFSQVCRLTGLAGRWQTLREHPKVICDTGHNPGGWLYLGEQLKQMPCKHLRMIVGMANDKDLNGILEQMPKNAEYYFTKASVKRAKDEQELMSLATSRHALKGRCFPSVEEAYQNALRDADPDDCIFAGGSSFIVADLLTFLETAAH